MSASKRWLSALLLGCVCTLSLAWSAQSVGYVRDEGIYFQASRHYAAWASQLLRDPGKALSPKIRDRHFRTNREHPPLMKLAGGLSARLLARPPQRAALGKKGAREAPDGGVFPWLAEGTAMRLPAQILAGLGVALLIVFGHALTGSVLAGSLAAGFFIFSPRVAFHASLHCFDLPIAIAILAVVAAYYRSLRDPRWGWWVGPLLGLAILIKHNALFVPVLLALHYASCLLLGRLRSSLPLTKAQLFPLPFLSMALLSPLVVFVGWPWLWSAPLDRLGAYFAFHREHSYYNMEFLGTNYNLPPLPWSYPWVMSWATLSSTFLLLSILGLALALRRDLRRHTNGERKVDLPPSPERASWKRPLPDPWPHAEGILLALFALFPLLLIAWPTVPIFGGTKHWLTAYPFWALASAFAWSTLWRHTLPRLTPRLGFLLPPALALFLVGPCVWATLHGHPFNLSQYAPLAGGARGAASMGLNRGFWGHTVLPLFEDSSGGKARPSTLRSLFLHDLHPLCERQYRREGRWPDWKSSPLSRSRAGLLFHERHTLHDELRLWEQLERNAPHSVIELDDVPLTSVYENP